MWTGLNHMHIQSQLCVFFFSNDNHQGGFCVHLSSIFQKIYFHFQNFPVLWFCFQSASSFYRYFPTGAAEFSIDGQRDHFSFSIWVSRLILMKCNTLEDTMTYCKVLKYIVGHCCKTVMVVVQPLGRSVNNLDRIVGGLQGIGSKCFGVPLSD